MESDNSDNALISFIAIESVLEVWFKASPMIEDPKRSDADPGCPEFQHQHLSILQTLK